MSSKLSQQELSDIMLQSVALSNILAEKFEVLTENGFVMHKVKQSLKNSINFLNVFVNKVFDVKNEDEITKEHMKTGASHVMELCNRIETALTAENLLSISDREHMLDSIIAGVPISEDNKVKLYEEIRDSGIIDY